MPAKATPLWKDLSKEEQQTIAALLQPKNQKARQGDIRPSRPLGFQLKGYVRCEFSSADKIEFKSWHESKGGEFFFGMLIATISDGYLFKCGTGKDGWSASFSAYSTGKSYDGYVLTGFASSPEVAISALIYKHQVMLDGDWTESAEPNGDDWLR